MSEQVGLYEGHYRDLHSDALTAVRRATYDVDLGQASCITLAEAREQLARLRLAPGDTFLEVASGTGGLTCWFAQQTGARCVGLDIDASAVEAAQARARDLSLAADVSFRRTDASAPLPFPDGAFDALFCNDSLNHLPDRRAALLEWARVLRRGGRVLFTDPVVTGQLSNEEIRARSSIGFFLFVPPGENERLLAEAGLTVLEVRDLTAAVASVSRRWREARAMRRQALLPLEGRRRFERLQDFLASVHALAAERRLSRLSYLAVKQ